MKSQSELDAMTDADLKAYAKEKDVDVKGNLNRDTLMTRVQERHAEIASLDLEGREMVDKTYTLDSGPVFTGGQVLEAAQRDSGLDKDEWNEADEKVQRKELEAFVEKTNFVPEPALEPIAMDKAEKKRIDGIMVDFPEVGYEVEENFITLNYRGAVYSHNIHIPEVVLRRQLATLLQAA